MSPYRPSVRPKSLVYALAMTDVKDNYKMVASSFDAAVRGVTPDKWEAPSPCERWRARDVVAHVVEGHRGVIAAVRGGEPEPLGVEEDPRQAWEEATRAIDEIAGDEAVLAMEIEGPVGKMPAGEIIGRFVTMDLLVHTWDLARAVGADERLDEESVRRAYEALKPMDAMIRQPEVFGPKLEPPLECRPADGVPLLPRPPGLARVGPIGSGMNSIA